MGEGKRHEQIALGETPNLAARLQGIAKPDTVIISETTYRLTEGFFTCQDLGFQSLKGGAAPLHVYQVLEESGLQSRFEIMARKGLPPLVGREREVALLLERWGQVKEGLGQVVLLSGEAGIGKSFLVQALKERVAKEVHVQLECRCSPYHRNSAFYPVVHLLQQLAQIKGDDTPAEKLSKLEATLEQVGFVPAEVVPLFAPLLSLVLPDRYAPLSLTSIRQRQKILETLLIWVLTQAEPQPVLLVVEDLQWIDPSTLELLSLFIDQGPTARILTVLTFRSEFNPPWIMRSHLTQLTLSRLSRKQAEVMVEKVGGGKALPTEVLRQLVDKTDGVPLFVEELTKMVLESDLLREQDTYYELAGPLRPLAIPATLHDSLMARLDRLGVGKETAQLGATLGREFTYELLRAVSPLEEARLQQDLARLAEAELLYQRGTAPQVRYFFKHALIQEAAYQSLLKSTRRQYHEQIARVLQEKFPEIRETQPELLAHHYTAAGLTEQAIPQWHKAGQRAVERSANLEAIGHLTKGLELLEALPDTTKRVQHEFALQITLGISLMATKGFAAPEVEKAYARARALCQQLGETPQLFPVLWGLWAFYSVRVESRAAQELGEQLLRLARSLQDPISLVAAHRALGQNLYFSGAFTSAQVHLDQAIVLYDPKQYRSYIARYGQDQGIIAKSFGAWTLWALGYPDQALRMSREAVSLAQELGHPLSLAFALHFAAVLHFWRREWQSVQTCAEAVITLATEQGLTFWLALGTFYRGCALAEQGQQEEGLTLMRRGVAAYQAAGAELGKPGYLFPLAQACGQAGQIEEGLQALAEALATVDRTQAHAYEAEVYRIKGQLTLQQQCKVQSAECKVPNTQHPTPSTQEAEACFQKAMTIAHRQSAKSLELRATTSLSRLWQQRGKRQEARQLLAAIYGWFTEGFDTADLQEAASLLGELN
jgi:predicted ATPase